MRKNRRISTNLADSPDTGLTLEEREAYAVLSARLELSRLPFAAIASLGGQVGWKVQLHEAAPDRSRELWFVLPPEYPRRAMFVVVRPGAYREWPHALRDARLCLWRVGHDPVGHSAREQAELVLARVSSILFPVLTNDTAAIEAEFAKEWLAYWVPERGQGHFSFGHGLFLGAPQREPCLIPATCAAIMPRKERLHVILGGSEAEHRTWVRALDAKPKRVLATAGLYVPLEKPPIGAPKNIQELDGLLEPVDGAQELLRELIATKEGPFFVVLGAGDPPGYAAVQVTRIPDLQPQRGFGSGRRRQRENRRAVGLRVATMSLERADPNWIHGRGFDEEARVLRGKHVVLVGCGVLGGLVARALAAGGVGRLTLIDPDILSAPNLGRHVLNTRHLAHSKAHGLAEEICAQLPHAIIKPHQATYESFTMPQGELAADLVISTTASWPVERHLMERLSRSEVSAVQVAWSENHALAGHALLGVAPDDDLLALFSTDGRFLREVTKPGKPLPLPGCDGTHQPGTFNRMQHIAACAVEQAIGFLTGVLVEPEHRCWTGDIRSVRKLGVEPHAESSFADGICEQTVLKPVPRRS